MLRPPGSPWSPHSSPRQGSPSTPHPQTSDSHPLLSPHPRRAPGEGRGKAAHPTSCCRALLLVSPYIWGRERRVGRHCCQWRLLTQIIIIKKNRYSWVLAEYGNYYYCQSRLEIIILKAQRFQLPRCFE